ncbi:MAG: AIR synthase-related protein, partial [Oceanipulchritudo sp.]
RKTFFNEHGLGPEDPLPGFRQKIGNALLKPHLNYSSFLRKALPRFNKASRASVRRGNAIFGAAHITGGGFTGNIPRVLPEGCGAVVNTNSWTPPPVFRALTAHGRIPFDEAYEVFNMGIGLVLAVAPAKVDEIASCAADCGHKALPIGRVSRGNRSVTLER